MTQAEKNIWQIFWSIGFETPDTTNFKMVKRDFPDFFDSLKAEPEDDKIKLITSLKNWILGVIEKNNEHFSKCVLKTEFNQKELKEYLNNKFHKLYEKNLIFLMFEKNEVLT